MATMSRWLRLTETYRDNLLALVIPHWFFDSTGAATPKNEGPWGPRECKTPTLVVIILPLG